MIESINFARIFVSSLVIIIIIIIIEIPSLKLF